MKQNTLRKIFFYLLGLSVLSSISFAYLVKFHDQKGRTDLPKEKRNVVVTIGNKRYNLNTACDRLFYNNGYLHCENGNGASKKITYGAFIDSGKNPSDYLDGFGEFPEQINVKIEEGTDNIINKKEFSNGISFFSGKTRKINGVKAEEFLLKSVPDDSTEISFDKEAEKVNQKINHIRNSYLTYNDLSQIKVLEKNAIMDNGKISLDNIVNFDMIDYGSENFFTICKEDCDFTLLKTDPNSFTESLQSAIEKTKGSLKKGILIKNGDYILTQSINLDSEDITIVGENIEKTVIKLAKDVDGIKIGNHGISLKHLTIDGGAEEGGIPLVINSSDIIVDDVKLKAFKDTNALVIENNDFDNSLANTEEQSPYQKYKTKKMLTNIIIKNSEIISSNLENPSVFLNLLTKSKFENNKIKGRILTSFLDDVSILNNRFVNTTKKDNDLIKIYGPSKKLAIKKNSFERAGDKIISLAPNKLFSYDNTDKLEEVYIQDNDILNVSGNAIHITNGGLIGRKMNIDNIFIVGNSIKDIGTDGIIIDCKNSNIHFCNNIEISNNIMENMNTKGEIKKFEYVMPSGKVDSEGTPLPDVNLEKYILYPRNFNVGNMISVYDINETEENIQSINNLKVINNIFTDNRENSLEILKEGDFTKYAIYYNSFKEKPLFRLNKTSGMRYGIESYDENNDEINIDIPVSQPMYSAEAIEKMKEEKKKKEQENASTGGTNGGTTGTNP